MGQKLPLYGQLGATRSRQDESKEVSEVGSKRTSSGGKQGGHHVCGAVGWADLSDYCSCWDTPKKLGHC
jgi:hypothetical protein